LDRRTVQSRSFEVVIRSGQSGHDSYNTKFSDPSSKGSGSLSVDMIEDGAVAGDYGVYHVGLEFDPLSPKAIALRRRQSRGYAQTYCCPTRGIVLGLLRVGMVGMKGVVGGSEGRRGE